jgi:hypothetical protein
MRDQRFDAGTIERGHAGSLGRGARRGTMGGATSLVGCARSACPPADSGRRARRRGHGAQHDPRCCAGQAVHGWSAAGPAQRSRPSSAGTGSRARTEGSGYAAKAWPGAARVGRSVRGPRRRDTAGPDLPADSARTRTCIAELQNRPEAATGPSHSVSGLKVRLQKRAPARCRGPLANADAWSYLRVPIGMRSA